MSLRIQTQSLPKGWVKKKLGDIAAFRNGLNFTKNSKGESIKIVGVKDFQDNFWLQEEQLESATIDGQLKETDVLREGDILTVRSNGNKELIGRCILVGHLSEKTSHSGFTIRVRIDRKDVYLPFVVHFLKSRDSRRKLVESGGGANISSLNQQGLSQFTINLPPFPEQKQIVAILDEAFEGIDRAIANTERNLANARELFESYLNQKLLSVASSEPTQTLSCITEMIVDCEHKTAPTQETGFPSIRTPNIGKGYLNFNNVNRVSEETYELWTRRAKPKPGDLILAREAPAGNVGVIPEGQTVCLGQRTVLIRPKSGIADSQYLAFLLLHPIMQSRLLAHSTGATVQHVNMKDIRKLAISGLPPSLNQTVCVQELEEAKIQVDRLEAIYEQKLAALNEFKQSILQKVFSGELTAEVDNLAVEGVKEVTAA